MRPAVLVAHAGGSYPVYVQPGGLPELPELAEQVLPGRRLVTITDRTVGRAVPLPDALKAPALIIPPGEDSKTRSRWSTLTDRMLELGYGRDAGIIAVGGGVVGDLAGFVAATYHRGIPWLYVPTSLLAMVDGSVGGKTGVNTRYGKNLVGAFHPPVAVLTDPQVLRTLHSTHRATGLVEAVKHGLVAEASYFSWIETRAEDLLALDVDSLTELVVRSVRIKAEIVSQDERESGRRAILNAGHTVGHAIEHVTEYAVPHGDAVAIGLVFEALLGSRLAYTESAVHQKLRALLQRLGRPTELSGTWSRSGLLAAMRHDKKVRGETIRFALPSAIGSMARDKDQWTIAVDDEIVKRTLATR